MSTKCIKCIELVFHRENVLECSVCKSLMHYYCVSYSEQDYKKISFNTKSKCTCSNFKTSLSNSPKSTSNKATKVSEKSMEKNI